jgi:uncharacterized repeat protein (TIGR01451 family)
MLARLLASLALIVSFMPAAANAAGSVALRSAVFLEKVEVGTDGRQRIMLREPATVTPGDTLVFILDYRNEGSAPATNLVVTNPVPPTVAYRNAADGAAQVSVDGGRNWGSLAALTVIERDGQRRSARPEDVTHIRWALKQGVPAGAQGKLSFRGVVR